MVMFGKTISGSDPLASTSMESSITRNNTTWNLDASYEVGQFVSGDYFVIDPGGGVTISAVPGDSSLNGSELNPQTPPIGSTSAFNYSQGINSRLEGYSATRRQTFPATLVAGDSLVSTIDWTSGNFWNGIRFSSNAKVKSGEILTVLSAVPFADTFRPAPADRNHTLYRTSAIDQSVLPNLSTAGIYSIETADRNGYIGLDYHYRGMERPWLIYGNDWQGARMHPYDNMPGYYQDAIGCFLGEVMLILCTDLRTDELVEKFCQICIDYTYIDNNNTTSPKNSHVWSPIIIMGGMLLQSSYMYNYWVNTGRATQRDGEKFFYAGDESDPYWTRRTEGTGGAAFGTSAIVPNGENWYGWAHPNSRNLSYDTPMFSKQVAPNQDYADYWYMEHLHPSEWDVLGTKQDLSENYRSADDLPGMVGMFLALRLMNAVTAEDMLAKCQQDACIDYIDLWMDLGFNVDNYKTSGQTYYDYMKTQAGEFTVYQYYQTPDKTLTDDWVSGTFQKDMWDTYRGTI